MPDKKDFLEGYIEVKDRIARFYELYGKGRLVTDHVEVLTAPDGKQRVMVRALAYRDPDDAHPAVGYSWMEIPGTTNYTRGSELENTETSAIGRAIGFLGILIDGSIASANEVRAKSGESHEATSDGGLIGTAEVGKPPADYEPRVEPDGQYVLAFRLVEGRKAVKVVARGELAEALSLVKADVIGHRVTCWGKVATETFRPKGATKDIEYPVMVLERIQTPNATLSTPVAGAPEQPSKTEVAGASDVGSPAPAALDAEIDALPMFQEDAAA